MIDETGRRPSMDWRFDIWLDEVSDVDRRRRWRQAVVRSEELSGIPMLPSPSNDPDVILRYLEAWIQGHPEERTRKLSSVTRAHFESGIETWVSRHGSRRLKQAILRGYKANRLYAQERSAADFPGFWVDTSGSARWRDRTDPSEAALDLEAELTVRYPMPEVNPRIVWLVDPPNDLEEEYGGIDEQEAILIDGFLGRYQLLLPVDEQFRRPSAQS